MATPTENIAPPCIDLKTEYSNILRGIHFRNLLLTVRSANSTTWTDRLKKGNKSGSWASHIRTIPQRGFSLSDEVGRGGRACRTVFATRAMQVEMRQCLRVGAPLRECWRKNGNRPDTCHSRGYGLPGRIYAAWPREDGTEEGTPMSFDVDSRLQLMHIQSPCWPCACRRGEGGCGSMFRGWSRSSRTNKTHTLKEKQHVPLLQPPSPLVCYV